ncbi:DUF1810 domain-containing protein [Ruegeria sp. HKCCD8929]|uniref:DUF1810 domain-containing protein n=1 Tax=Ruegeria sp. HKCCD8929 TaxID=2683006 RepID=UPI0014894AB0|nr:DUF1810 domain-containing protein [Ruegeria sp. HKCCD8929]
MSGLDPVLFIKAQDRVWPSVLKELEQGQKTSHWMWFVFPQLSALGRSPTAQRYGIADLDQAADYLANPVLRDRLIEVSRLMLSHSGTSASAILGPVDAMKLRSSMTLFSLTKNAPLEFKQVLDAFYEGPCPLTLQFTST